MTSYKEPNFSYTEATLRREVHTDNSHWELMYKAMLAQLMSYVDAAVARALAERGLDGYAAPADAGPLGATERTGHRAPAMSTEAAAPSDAMRRRSEPAMSGPFVGAALPPWLQPFALPEQVRFTRTPDALLRSERTPPAVEEEVSAPVTETVEAPSEVEPAWKSAMALPSNVRFNRTPYAKPTDESAATEAVVVSLLDVHADRALAAAALGDHDTAVPSAWFEITRDWAPRPADEQDNAGLGAAEPLAEADDDHAAAWLEAHARVTGARALRLAPDEPLAEILAAVEAVALDPLASMHPYGTPDAILAAVDAPVDVPLPEPREVDAAVPIAQPDADAGATAIALPVPEMLALPAPDWLVGTSPADEQARGLGPYGDPCLWAVDPPPAPVNVDPYGDPTLWFVPPVELVAPPAEVAVVAAAPLAPTAVVAAAPLAPIGIASPEDVRAVVAPVRTGLRRTLAEPHGLAPFQQANRAATDPEYYVDPPIELLVPPPEPTGEVMSSGALEQNARLLEGVLEEFGVRGEIIDVRPGPVVTLYELEPAPGTKSSRVIGLADDIARSMSAVSARVAVVQGRNVIGIELPNARRETVYLRELVDAEDFSESKHKLAIALGKTIGGESVIVDLARMPHLLVAGTTGSGKSVAINTMILSILYRFRPEQCRLIMIDPKMLELSIYEGIPHLLTPVVTDPKKAVVALKWAVREMEDRYKKMSKVGVRNIDGFNARVTEAAHRGEVITRTIQTGFNRETGEPIFESEEMELSPLPYIVVIVDEMADLMMVAGKDIEGAIQRLAQMARAAGIHLIMATQRPSVDVITGTIKANFPTRISFQVTSKIDSRTILGEQGAEQLLGQGDMLYMAGGGRISRVHGPFVSDGEVEGVVAHLKAQGHPAYLDVVVAEEGQDDSKAEAPEDRPVFDRSAMGGSDDDADLYDQAVKVVLRDKKCSTSYIQRRLAVGYNKAASLVERMEKEGIVGQANNAGKREILVYSRDLRYTETRDEE